MKSWFMQLRMNSAFMSVRTCSIYSRFAVVVELVWNENKCFGSFWLERKDFVSFMLVMQL